METALCWLLCAKIAIQQPKNEPRQETPQVEQRIEQKDPVRVDDAKRVQKPRRQVSTGSDAVIKKPSTPNVTHRTGQFKAVQTKVLQKTKEHFGEGHEGYMDYIMDHESDYDPTVRNPHSSAGGVPQALPWTKMGCALSWNDKDIDCQINWMMGYVKNRYKTPYQAYLFKVENGWY